MTRIKICGITRSDQGIAVAGMGVEYLGFIFYPPSPRYIEPEKACEIIRAIREAMGKAAPKMIGVFVDETAEHMEHVREIAGLDGVQLSGDESPEIGEQLQPLRFRGLSLETLDRLRTHPADAWLCDTHAPEEKGGTGRAYDYLRLLPHVKTQPVIVAGGLTPVSVGDVVRQLRPWGVDVSSAVELSPGRKDLEAVQAFVEAVRRADARS
ncbi:MAG: phosphoribosylanthranilate isomerase [Candidatus Sumerlaeota bacterium]